MDRPGEQGEFLLAGVPLAEVSAGQAEWESADWSTSVVKSSTTTVRGVPSHSHSTHASDSPSRPLIDKWGRIIVANAPESMNTV